MKWCSSSIKRKSPEWQFREELHFVMQLCICLDVNRRYCLYLAICNVVAGYTRCGRDKKWSDVQVTSNEHPRNCRSGGVLHFVIQLCICKSDFLILFFPDFRQILFLFIHLMHPCTRLIFCTVLTVSLMTGLSSFGALPQCDIVFTWDFSVFCHFIFLDSVLENYNGMKELFEKRKKHLPRSGDASRYQ